MCVWQERKKGDGMRENERKKKINRAQSWIYILLLRSNPIQGGSKQDLHLHHYCHAHHTLIIIIRRRVMMMMNQGTS